MSTRDLRFFEWLSYGLLSLELPYGWWLAAQPFGARSIGHAVALVASALALAKGADVAASARALNERKSSPVRFE